MLFFTLFTAVTTTTSMKNKRENVRLSLFGKLDRFFLQNVKHSIYYRQLSQQFNPSVHNVPKWSNAPLKILHH